MLCLYPTKLPSGNRYGSRRFDHIDRVILEIALGDTPLTKYIERFVVVQIGIGRPTPLFSSILKETHKVGLIELIDRL